VPGTPSVEELCERLAQRDVLIEVLSAELGAARARIAGWGRARATPRSRRARMGWPSWRRSRCAAVVGASPVGRTVIGGRSALPQRPWGVTTAGVAQGHRSVTLMAAGRERNGCSSSSLSVKDRAGFRPAW